MSLRTATDLLNLTVYAGLLLAGILLILIWIKNLTRKITYLRFFIQTAALLAIFSTVLLIAQWNYLVLGIIFLLTIFFGRFFCGWICPFGFYMDLITLLRKPFKIRHRTLSERLNKALHKLRYVIAASVLTLPFFIGPLDPNVWSSLFLFQGAFKPLIIFFLGPLETIIIPYSGLIGFNGYSASYPYIRGITIYFGETLIPLLAVLAFVAVTAVSAFFFRRSWCRFCPTGISIAIVNRFRGFKWAPLLHINKVEEKCTKCGICKRVCPVQVTEVYEQKGGNIETSMCLLCLRCVEMCPYEGCLKVNMGGKTLIHSRNWLEKAKQPAED